ncbi:MAG: DMT family transporter, partial [Pseudomonadota bacterium]
MGGALKGMLLALLAFALYSTHDTIIKELGSRYAVFQIILFGNLFAFLPMSIMMLADGRNESFRPHHPGLVVLRTIASVAGMVCGFYAFTVLPLAETYALIFMMPLIITLLSVPILGERIGVNRLAAVIVGFMGVLVVLRPGTAELSLGHAAALGTACFGSIAVIIVRKIGGSERSAVLILFPMIASICLMGATMPWTYRPVDGIDMALMALIGLFVVFAQLTIIAAYRAAPA